MDKPDHFYRIDSDKIYDCSFIPEKFKTFRQKIEKTKDHILSSNFVVLLELRNGVVSSSSLFLKPAKNINKSRSSYYLEVYDAKNKVIHEDYLDQVSSDSELTLLLEGHFKNKKEALSYKVFKMDASGKKVIISEHFIVSDLLSKVLLAVPDSEIIGHRQSYRSGVEYRIERINHFLKSGDREKLREYISDNLYSFIMLSTKNRTILISDNTNFYQNQILEVLFAVFDMI